MPNCCASNCFHRHDQGFRLFRFPSHEERRAIWIERSRPRKLTPHSRLCEYHFHDSCFENKRADGIRKLKSNALPTIFSDINIVGESTMPIPPKPVEEIKIYKENVNLFLNSLNKQNDTKFLNNHLEKEENNIVTLDNVISKEQKNIFISFENSLNNQHHVVSVDTTNNNNFNSFDISPKKEPQKNIHILGKNVDKYPESYDENLIDQDENYEYLENLNEENPSSDDNENKKIDEAIFPNSDDDNYAMNYECLSDCELIDKQEQNVKNIDRKIEEIADASDDDNVTRLDTTFFPTDNGTICQANEIKSLRSQLMLAHKKIDIITKQKKELQSRLKQTAPMQRKYNKLHNDHETMKKLTKKSPMLHNFVDNFDGKSNWTQDCIELATKIRYSIGLQAYLKLKNDVGIPLPSHATICRYVKKKKPIDPDVDGPAKKVLKGNQ